MIALNIIMKYINNNTAINMISIYSSFITSNSINIIAITTFVMYMICTLSALYGWKLTNYSTNREISDRYTTLITPADWAFRIWQFIGIGEAVGLLNLLMYANREADLFKKVFSLINVLSSLWLLTFTRKYFIISSVILVTIVLALKVALDSVLLASIISSWSLPMTLLIVIPIKVHYAFSLIATGLNLNVLLVYTDINYRNVISKQVEYFFAMMTLWIVAGYSLYENIYNNTPFISFVVVWALSAIADKAKHKTTNRESEKIVNQSIELTCLLLICCLSLCGLFKANSPYKKIYDTDGGALPLSILPLSLLLLFVLSFHILIGHAILKQPFERMKKDRAIRSASTEERKVEID